MENGEPGPFFADYAVLKGVFEVAEHGAKGSLDTGSSLSSGKIPLKAKTRSAAG